MTIKFRTKLLNGFTVDADYVPFTFPAGEAHIKMNTHYPTGDVEYQLADLRGADSHELMQLAMWADAIWRREEKAVVLLPYLPGARADRGEPIGAAVYAEFLNSMVLSQIIAIDPHSQYIVDSVFGLTVYPFERIIKRELGNYGNHSYVGVIAPDEGARDRAKRAATVLGVPVYQAGKQRDFETGKLTGFYCESLPKTGKLLLVDDICDGGGTFVGLADHLMNTENIYRDRLDLWVTHGIFSKGVHMLTDRFAHIYTTTSYPFTLAPSDAPSEAQFVTQFNLLPYLTGEINV